MMLLTLMTACNINDRYCCELLWKISSSKIPEASRKMWPLLDGRKHVCPMMQDNPE